MVVVVGSVVVVVGTVVVGPVVDWFGSDESVELLSSVAEEVTASSDDGAGVQAVRITMSAAAHDFFFNP